MDLYDSFSFMFDVAYKFNHNLEIDLDTNIVAAFAFSVLHQGLSHPHV